MVLFDRQGKYLMGAQLLLETRKGRQIPNERRPEHHPDRLKAAQKQVLDNHGSAVARSLTGMYNCMGMMFAARRTCIEPDYLEMILNDDDYHQLVGDKEVMVGDVVVYKRRGEVTHVGLVAFVQTNLREGIKDIKVLSQWGADGEYLHDVDDVNPTLGIATEYWSDRK